MQKNIPMSVSVYSEYFDTESGEKYDEISANVIGCLQKKDEQYKIIYKETSDGSDIITELVFSDGNNRLVVNKKGYAECKMVFSEKKQSSFIYRLPYGDLDAEITTHTLTNTIDTSGGEIYVLYTLSLGGQTQKISMKISAEASK